MNDELRFDDPAFVARMHSWAAERRTTDRAPSSLVDSIMDDVVASPRRSPWIARLPLRGAVGYAGLTAAITVGVTLGILLAGRLAPEIGNATQTPGASAPIPSVSAPSSAIPRGSPVVLAGLSDVLLPASVVGASGDSIWVAERNGRLDELDPESGDVVRSVDLRRPVDNLLVTGDSVWAASAQGNLVRISRLDLAVTEVPTGPGHALAEEAGVVWLGQADGITRVDAGAIAVDTSFVVPNRAANLGLAVDGSSIWVATRAEILRLDADSGETLARIHGDAVALALLDGTLWATRGSELLRIDPTTAEVLEFIPGLSSSGPVAVGRGALWIGDGSGPSTLEGWDLGARTQTYVAEVPGAVTTLAVTSDTLWVATEQGPAVARFRLP